MNRKYEKCSNDPDLAKPQGCRCAHFDSNGTCHHKCILLIPFRELWIGNTPNERAKNKQMELD